MKREGVCERCLMVCCWRGEEWVGCGSCFQIVLIKCLQKGLACWWYPSWAKGRQRRSQSHLQPISFHHSLWDKRYGVEVPGEMLKMRPLGASQWPGFKTGEHHKPWNCFTPLAQGFLPQNRKIFTELCRLEGTLKVLQCQPPCHGQRLRGHGALWLLRSNLRSSFLRNHLRNSFGSAKTVL